MQRVVILSAFLSPYRSGAEACAEEVALRLCDRYDITIVTARMRRDLPLEDLWRGKVKVIRVGLGYGFDMWLFPFWAPIRIWMLRRRASIRPAVSSRVALSGAKGVSRDSGATQHDTFIIHAILETFAGLALDFCKYFVPGAIRILTLQTMNRSFLKGFLIRSADHVTAISSALVRIAQDFGRNDVTLIPNGIDMSRVLTLGKDSGRVLFVGRLEKMKGVDTLLRAFDQVKGEGVHLRVVGDVSQRQALERLTEELGIGDRATFVGFVPVNHVYEEFAKAQILCGLSRSEALGNVFLEAQAEGCAVIGTNVGGIPDIVQDGETGILVEPDDVEAVARAMQKLIDDPQFRSQLAKRGEEHAKKYDWGIMSEQYLKLYNSIE